MKVNIFFEKRRIQSEIRKRNEIKRYLLEYTGVKSYKCHTEGTELPHELTEFCERIRDIDAEIEILNSSLRLRSGVAVENKNGNIPDIVAAEVNEPALPKKKRINGNLIKRILCAAMVLASVFVLLYAPFMTASSQVEPYMAMARNQLAEQRKADHITVTSVVSAVENWFGVGRGSTAECVDMILRGRYSLRDVVGVLKPLGSILSAASNNIDNQDLKDVLKLYTIGQIFITTYFIATIVLGLLSAFFILIGKKKRIDIAYYVFVIFGLIMVAAILVAKGYIQDQLSKSVIATILALFNKEIHIFDNSLWPFLALVLAFPFSIYSRFFRSKKNTEELQDGSDKD